MRAQLAAALAAGSVLALPPRASVAWLLTRRSPSARKRLAPWDAEAECLMLLDSMVVLLEAGTPALQALELATDPMRSAQSQTAEGWRRLCRAAQADEDVAAVWDALALEWDCPPMADVAAAWRMSARHGCPLAESMAAAAGGIRAARRHRGSVESAVAGARATMGVLLLLPLLGVALGTLLGVDMADTYTGLTGLVTLWPGLMLLWLGRRWANSLVERALRSDDDAVTT